MRHADRNMGRDKKIGIDRKTTNQRDSAQAEAQPQNGAQGVTIRDAAGA